MTYQDDLEKHFLVDLHEFLVPLVDVSRLLARVGVVVGRSRRVGAVVGAPLNDLTKDGLVDVGNGDGVGHGLVTNVFDHVFNQNRTFSDLAF